jgi:two-component system, sensor histidine kinase
MSALNNMEVQNTTRIDHISRMIFEIASGNYDYHVDRTEQEDELDAIIVGINMLREELKATTVSRDYMNNLIEGVVDLIFILDKNFVIQSVNEAVVDLLGFKEADLTGKDFISVLEKNSVIALDSVQRSLATNKFIKDIELRIGSNDNKVIPTSSSFSILYDKGVESGILIIAKDISRLKKAEDEMRKAKEHAEAANIAKSRFLANMSHEIRTPLNGILGIAEIMASEIKDPTQREYIDIMRTSGKNLAKLINDILDLSKIESGKLTLEQLPFTFSDTIKNNLQSYKYLAEQKGLAFTCDIDENIPATIIGDSTRINQVVANLVGNAIKFTDKGSVGIRFRLLAQHQGEVTLFGEVKDTGIGIPKEKEKIIFESFAQADDSVTRKYGGTGLGLSIVENLVRQMGGQVNVDSPNEESGTGTVFKFTLKVAVPVSQSLNKANGKEEAGNASGHALKVLVVDDNNINQLVARKILEKLGTRVTVASSGQEAITLVKSSNFDLIFMDIQMPDMDGYETSIEIRKLNFKNPIIALSANAYNEHVQRSMEAGMDGHLQKPFTPNEIQGFVTKCISDKQKGKVAA